MSNRPKLILAANAIPKAGGQGLNLQHMIEGLGGLFDVSVFCQGGQPDVPTTHISAGSPSRLMARLPVVRRLRDLQILLTDADFDRKVSRLIGSAAYFQGATGQCRDSLARAQQSGALAMLDVVTFHIEDFSRASQEECARFGMRPIHHPYMMRRILEEYRCADLIRVMSEPARQTFLSRGFPPSKVFVATPPFDLASFPEASFVADKFTVSYVGLLEPSKGFHYLVEAFASLNRHDSELLLWGNTGARPIRQYLDEQIAACRRIRIVPELVSKIGYASVYGKSSVLVHPSLADGFGFVIGEAMACGIPVITTPATGASEWVIDGVNGYIVPVRDSEAIRDRLEYLMDHPVQLREMGQAARETMSKLTMQRFRGAYENALGGAVSHV